MFTFCRCRSWPMLSRRDPDTPVHPAPNLEPALALKQYQVPHLQRWMPGELVMGGLAAARAAANPSSALWPPVIR